MTDELVGFEVAKLAKEKEFDMDSGMAFMLTDNGYIDAFYCYTEEEKDLFIARPTQSLLQRWLREKHGIDIWIQPIYLNKAIGSSVKTGYIINGGLSEEFDTYEQALEEGLLTALKLIE